MPVNYPAFSDTFPELILLLPPNYVDTFDRLLPGWLAEIGSFYGKVCFPPNFTLETGLTEESVYDQLRYLWIAHNLVVTDTTGTLESLYSDNIKKVESLDNIIEFQYKPSESRYDLSLTAYGKRYLDMLGKYSCTKLAEDLRGSLHEIAGLATEFESGCCDGEVGEDWILW